MLSQGFFESIIMTTNADNDNAPGEILTHNLPSYNKKNDDQGLDLEDYVAELPFAFGNDTPEDEEPRSSNQTRGLNRRNMIILGIIAAIVFLCFVTGISSAALTDNNNNSMVVESFNNAAAGSAKSSKAPTTAKTSKAQCVPHTIAGNPTDSCLNCCGTGCPSDKLHDCGGTSPKFCYCA